MSKVGRPRNVFDPTPSIEFKVNIDRLVKQLGGHRELAKQIGMSASTIYTWKCTPRKAAPSLETLVKFGTVDYRVSSRAPMMDVCKEWLAWEGRTITDEELARHIPSPLQATFPESFTITAQELRRLAVHAESIGPLPVSFLLALVREMRED